LERDRPVASLRIIALYVACISIVNCSGFTFVGFVSNPGGTTSITGTVLTVNGGFVSDPSGITQVTSVAFDSSGTSITLVFCGDQHALFPVSIKIRADYTTGVLCSFVTKVVIVGEPQNS
jgi:hypothetical protein